MQRAAQPIVKHKHQKCFDNIQGMHTIPLVLRWSPAEQRQWQSNVGLQTNTHTHSVCGCVSPSPNSSNKRLCPVSFLDLFFLIRFQKCMAKYKHFNWLKYRFTIDFKSRENILLVFLRLKGDTLYHQVWVWLAVTSSFENRPLPTSQVGLST